MLFFGKSVQFVPPVKLYHALVDLIPPVGSGAAFLANAKDASKTQAASNAAA